MRGKEIDGENRIALWCCIIFSSLEDKNGKHILQYPSMYLANCFSHFGLQWHIQLLILVLAGTELTFSQVAGIVLHFGFSVRTTLKAQWYSGCCWVALTLNQGLSSVPYSASEEVHEELAGAGPGQVTWTGPRDIPYHRTPRTVSKLGELDMKGQSLLGLGLQVVSHCTWHHMPFLGFISFSPSCSFFPLQSLLYFISIIKLFFFQLSGFPFSLLCFSSPFHQKGWSPSDQKGKTLI